MALALPGVRLRVAHGFSPAGGRASGSGIDGIRGLTAVRGRVYHSGNITVADRICPGMRESEFSTPSFYYIV